MWWAALAVKNLFWYCKIQILEQSMHVAERCRKAIEEIELFSDDGRQIYVTASFGIAISSS